MGSILSEAPAGTGEWGAGRCWGSAGRGRADDKVSSHQELGQLLASAPGPHAHKRHISFHARAPKAQKDSICQGPEAGQGRRRAPGSETSGPWISEPLPPHSAENPTFQQQGGRPGCGPCPGIWEPLEARLLREKPLAVPHVFSGHELITTCLPRLAWGEPSIGPQGLPCPLSCAPPRTSSKTKSNCTWGTERRERRRSRCRRHRPEAREHSRGPSGALAATADTTLGSGPDSAGTPAVKRASSHPTARTARGQRGTAMCHAPRRPRVGTANHEDRPHPQSPGRESKAGPVCTARERTCPAPARTHSQRYQGCGARTELMRAVRALSC